jgi:sugar phosphate isomerase/epimerase
LLPGAGYLPLKKLLTQVKDDAYDGIITLETCPAAMGEYKVEIEKNARMGLEYIRNTLKDSHSDVAAGTVAEETE